MGLFEKKIVHNCNKQGVEGEKNLRNKKNMEGGIKINKHVYLFIREMTVTK